MMAGRRRRLLIAALLSVPLLILASFFAWEYVAARGFQGQLNRASKMGLPLSAKDVRRIPAPPGENAADLLKSLRQPYDSLPRGSANVSVASAALVVSSLKPDRRDISLALEAASMPACDLGWDFTLQEIRPELHYAKANARALAYMAIHEAAQGRPDSALSYFKAALDLGRLIGMEPHSLALAVQSSIETIAVMSMITAAPALGSQHGRELLALAEAQKFQPLDYYLQGDLIEFVDLLSTFKGQFDGPEDYMADVRRLYKWCPPPVLRGAKNQVLARFLDEAEITIEYASDPEEALRELMSHRAARSGAGEAAALIEEGLSIKRMDTGPIPMAKFIAQRRMRLVILRRELGLSVPSDINRDPFTGRPFQQVSLQPEYKVLASAGPNGTIEGQVGSDDLYVKIR